MKRVQKSHLIDQTNREKKVEAGVTIVNIGKYLYFDKRGRPISGPNRQRKYISSNSDVLIHLILMKFHEDNRKVIIFNRNNERVMDAMCRNYGRPTLIDVKICTERVEYVGPQKVRLHLYHSA